jgi:hypothetical protein
MPVLRLPVTGRYGQAQATADISQVLGSSLDHSDLQVQAHD